MHAADPVSSRHMMLRAESQAVRATLRLAQALATSGERIDLAGLDDQIGRFCAGILDLPPAVGLHWRDELRALAQETGHLHATLAAQTSRSAPPPPPG